MPSHHDTFFWGIIPKNFLNYSIDRDENNIQTLLNVIEINPYNVMYHFSLYQALEKQGYEDQAMASLNKALRIDPELKVTRELGRIIPKQGP